MRRTLRCGIYAVIHCARLISDAYLSYSGIHTLY